MRREYKREKGNKVEEIWECEGWERFKTNDKFKNHVRTQFSYRRRLSDSLLVKLKDRYLFGYVHCILIVPNELKSKFDNFPAVFKIKMRLEEMILKTHWKTMQSRMER